MKPTRKPMVPKSIHNYRLVEELGHGAFSTVFKSINSQGMIFAIKVFPKSNLSTMGDQERFQREINSMAYLRHDNLVALHDFFWDNDNFYLVLDYCPGGELYHYIATNEKVPEPTAALIFQQVASAVAYCHSLGVAHRDLKPENILIEKFPNVKVTDFGLSGYIDDQKMMKTFCGSPAYCAPECLSHIQYDGRMSDVWSLGVILFTLVTGEHPWNIANTSMMLRQILRGIYTVPPYVSPQCKELISLMINVDPQQRIPMAEILKHPWLKCAANAKINQKAGIVVNPPSLPPLQPISLLEIANEAAKNSKRRDSGIFSPFEEQADATGGSSDSLLPKLSVRSASLENVKVANGITPLNTTRKKVTPPASMSLAANRQRSANNLIARKSPMPSPRQRMMTIAED